MTTTERQTKCLFCGGLAQVRRSCLDVLGVPPDIYRIECVQKHCGVVYHCDGSLKTTQPDLTGATDTLLRIKAANLVGVPIALILLTDGIEVREYSDRRDD
jgi:hypothetical protein